MEKQQKVAAVICEYNPFHYGHKHQINIMKENFDLCIGVMSGPFVQRGTVAVADKYSRAAAAVKGGLDLVVELPFPYCCSAAADFAAAGVHIAAAVGANFLVFGAEDAGEAFDALTGLLANATLQDKARALIKEEKSLSYPRALSLAAAELGGETPAKALAKPNNILGAEYVAAINRGGYDVTPFPIKRKEGFLSSTDIRSKKSFEGLIPFPEFFENRRGLEALERWIMAVLRGGNHEGLYCIDPSLSATLEKAAKQATSLEETVALATGKVYTTARIRRAILAAWLGITAAEVKATPAYTLLLAANEKGTAYLKSIRKSIGISLITKPSSYKALTDTAAFEKALYAEEMAALCEPKLAKYASPLCNTPKVSATKQ